MDPCIGMSGLTEHASALLRAIAAADAGGVVAALRGLSERWTERTGPAEDRELQLESDQGPLVRLAIMGTATPTQMRRVSVNWPLVRDLVRAGAIERPAAYIPALLRMRWWGEEELLPALLDGDPEFWERDVWDMIAYRGEDASQRAAEVCGWSELIAARVTERDRLLDAILDALPDQSAYRAAWYTKVWKLLKPTPAEHAARAGALRGLLGDAAEPIVAFALDALVRGRVPIAAADLAPALAASSKSTVRKALRQLDGDPAVAAIALGHPDPDVQGEVLDRLERWVLDDAARDTLLRHLDLLAATQRPRAEALLGVAFPSPAAVVEVDVDDVPAEIRAALSFGGRSRTRRSSSSRSACARTSERASPRVCRRARTPSPPGGTSRARTRFTTRPGSSTTTRRTTPPSPGSWDSCSRPPSRSGP